MSIGFLELGLPPADLGADADELAADTLLGSGQILEPLLTTRPISALRLEDSGREPTLCLGDRRLERRQLATEALLFRADGVERLPGARRPLLLALGARHCLPLLLAN